mmetsp:Transcript_6657/g.20240  ORF Transcript_6657/g.20240 Transcript_6657/m.20240 type:complete len:276 (-) Transcript_6657:2273-3100(-)
MRVAVHVLPAKVPAGQAYIVGQLQRAQREVDPVGGHVLVQALLGVAGQPPQQRGLAHCATANHHQLHLLAGHLFVVVDHRDHLLQTLQSALARAVLMIDAAAEPAQLINVNVEPLEGTQRGHARWQRVHLVAVQVQGSSAAQSVPGELRDLGFVEVGRRQVEVTVFGNGRLLRVEDQLVGEALVSVVETGKNVRAERRALGCSHPTDHLADRDRITAEAQRGESGHREFGQRPGKLGDRVAREIHCGALKGDTVPGQSLALGIGDLETAQNKLSG